MEELVGSHDNRRGMKSSRMTAVLGSLILVGSNLGAVEPNPYQIPRIDQRITVDGVLDEQAWNDAWSMTRLRGQAR